WLRSLEEGAPAPSAAPPDTSGNGGTPTQPGAVLKVLGRLLTSVKRVSVNYTESATASIYGYTDSTRVLGMNFRSMAPGLPYVFGKQPDTSFISELARRGLVTGDPDLNFQNRQDYSQNLSINANLMPVRDLTIDLRLEKTFGKMYSELYKDTTENGYSGNFARLNPFTEGSFSVSYISYKTLFTKIHTNEVSETFLKFQDYRGIISERLGKENIASGASGTDGYCEGYGRYSQEVLLPAFLAAYTGKDPSSIALMKNGNPNIR